ncbi:MAG: excinuclease ABC subunit B [Myxococcales bacterium]|nr:excinuclease ABC subunit B [Myxococcales bacterium]
MDGLEVPVTFRVDSPYTPTGDQPQAIEALCRGLCEGRPDQVLLGVTGSGKTFTMAHVIAQSKRPALVLAHNKTLAGQLFQELSSLLPEMAVEYFVSYYDYYQPEAYVPTTDTYVEKDSSINDEIDRMRHRATRALLERRDVVVVASVSCIYGIGTPDFWRQMMISLSVGQSLEPRAFMERLVAALYDRNDTAFDRGTFRVRGDLVEVYPAHEQNRALRFSFFGDELERIQRVDALTGRVLEDLESAVVYPGSHYVLPADQMKRALRGIRQELQTRLEAFKSQGKLLELQRLDQRTRYDLELLDTLGTSSGIENYSRWLSGRAEGEPPPTLIDYFPDDVITFVDESHVTIGQVRGMYRGDRARKETLVDHGFRLPSALDNRPLRFDEWVERRHQAIYVSATPGDYELGQTHGEVVEQLIRPTGLLDPEIEIRPVRGQVDDLVHEIRKTTGQGLRVLVTTLTKKMAEDLAEYFEELGIRCRYLHADVDTLERIELLAELRQGVYDVLIGINLLREGLDLPEVGLVAVLDADRSGFLRNERSLIQTVGRAARNVNGRALLYAEQETVAIKAVITETHRRRQVQAAHNERHGITPKSTVRELLEMPRDRRSEDRDVDRRVAKHRQSHRAEGASPPGQDDLLTFLQSAGFLPAGEMRQKIKSVERSMRRAAAELDFEEAAKLREELRQLKELSLLSS